MSDWTQHKPKLALYDILDTPGGVSVETAMQRAEQAIAHFRAEALIALDKSVRQLDEAARARTATPAQIYTLAMDVLDVAGLYHPPLCRAANSLCDLAQRMGAAKRWDWPAVAVHVSAMRLMKDKTDERDGAVQAVLKGLAEVVAKYPEAGAQESGDKP